MSFGASWSFFKALSGSVNLKRSLKKAFKKALKTPLKSHLVFGYSLVKACTIASVVVSQPGARRCASSRLRSERSIQS